MWQDIIVAIKENNLVKVKNLIHQLDENGLDKQDQDGNTLLHYAAFTGSIEVYNLLLTKMKLDAVKTVDKDNKTAEYYILYRNTILHYARQGDAIGLGNFLSSQLNQDFIAKEQRANKTRIFNAVRINNLKLLLASINEPASADTINKAIIGLMNQSSKKIDFGYSSGNALDSNELSPSPSAATDANAWLGIT